VYKAIILPLAKQDIKEAAHWYEDKQKNLGKRFTQEVRTDIRFLKGNPTATAVRYDSVRCSVLKIFPFMIHYTIDEAKKVIIITAVLHTSQDPNLWKERY